MNIDLVRAIAAKDPRYRKYLPQEGAPATDGPQSPTDLYEGRKPLPCVYEGAKAQGNDLRKTYYHCEAGKGVVCKCTCNACHCDRYTADHNEVDIVPVGVVIGHYAMAPLVDLGIRSLCDLCGSVPVLVHDDHSPEPHGSQIEAVCNRHVVELVRSGRERIGHAGGDLGAFYHGLQWARKRQFRVLIKISQRFLPRKQRWVQDAAEQIVNSKNPTLSDCCIEGVHQFTLRTEAVAMDVEQWATDENLKRLRPHPLGRLPCEVLVGSVMQQLGPLGVWKLLGGPDRCHRTPGLLWHCANSEADYRAVAKNYGVDLGDDFDCRGWIKRDSFQRG